MNYKWHPELDPQPVQLQSFLDSLHLSMSRHPSPGIRNTRAGPRMMRMGWWCVRLYQWYVTWSSHHCGRVTLACDTQWLVTVTRHTVSHVTRDTGHWGSGLEVTSGHTQSTHQTCVTADVTLNIMILSHCFFLHIFRLIFLIHSWHAHDVMLCLYFSKGQFEMRKLLKCHKSRITT